MAYDFPSNPTTGQIYNNFVWNGTAWDGLGQANNVGTQIAALNTASPKTVANAAARDALYPAPVQGNSVFRTDLGYIETYYSVYNVSTNPGGTLTAGWYSDNSFKGSYYLSDGTFSAGTALAINISTHNNQPAVNNWVEIQKSGNYSVSWNARFGAYTGIPQPGIYKYVDGTGSQVGPGDSVVVLDTVGFATTIYTPNVFYFTAGTWIRPFVGAGGVTVSAGSNRTWFTVTKVS